MSQRAKVLWVIALAIVPLVALSGFTIWQQYLRDEAMVAAERPYFAHALAPAPDHALEPQGKGPVSPARMVEGKPTVLIAAAPVPTERFAQGLMAKICSP